MNQVSLKEYIEARFMSEDKARSNAYQQMERRLEGMNEFRQQINKLQGSFITRNELDLILDRLNKDKSSALATIVSLIALAVGVFGLLKG